MPIPPQTNNDDDNLVLYRLKQVEDAVKEVGDKVDRQDNIKRIDLVEFRDAILGRFNDVKDDLQKQIDKKADQKQVDDLRTLIKAVGGFLGSIIVGLVVAYFTTGGNK